MFGAGAETRSAPASKRPGAYEYQNDIGNDVLNGVIVVGGTIAIVCLFIDDGTGVGVLDDAAIPPLLAAVLEALQGM